MSYMRSPSMLHHFHATSDLYVYKTDDGMEDCHATYDHDPSFIELIGIIIERETCDQPYARKIIEILADKLNCKDQLRDIPLTYDEWSKENKKLFEFLEFGKSAIESYYLIKNMSHNNYSEEDIANYIARMHIKELQYD